MWLGGKNICLTWMEPWVLSPEPQKGVSGLRTNTIRSDGTPPRRAGLLWVPHLLLAVSYGPMSTLTFPTSPHPWGLWRRCRVLVAAHICLVHRPPSPAGPSVYHLVHSLAVCGREPSTKPTLGTVAWLKNATVYGKALKQEACFIIT